jgi:4-deoxy-L-threo-5-hexosulose-uronate ketol-isomerase
MMEVRYATNPRELEFLVRSLFVPGRISMTYSHYDRMIVGGACPATPLSLEGGKELGTAFFLERRELGIINVGPEGTVTVDGRQYDLGRTDGLYMGMGSKEIGLASKDGGSPARFFFLSGPAHKEYPTVLMRKEEAETVRVGSPGEASARIIHKYIHPGGVKSCNLVMGLTDLEPNNVWNSMPCHTHDRRMEVYFYFDLPENGRLFHFMGQPDKTRHIVVQNEEAVISPSWSIHSGVGTSNYSFIWGMAGDNQAFSDMDAICMKDLR